MRANNICTHGRRRAQTTCALSSCICAPSLSSSLSSSSSCAQPNSIFICDKNDDKSFFFFCNVYKNKFDSRDREQNENHFQNSYDPHRQKLIAHCAQTAGPVGMVVVVRSRIEKKIAKCLCVVREALHNMQLSTKCKIKRSSCWCARYSRACACVCALNSPLKLCELAKVKLDMLPKHRSFFRLSLYTKYFSEK